jgi:hypothetical protein
MFTEKGMVLFYEPDRNEKIDVIVKNCVEFANKKNKEVQTTFLSLGIRVFPGDDVGTAALRFLGINNFELQENKKQAWKEMAQYHFDSTYGQGILYLVSDIAWLAEPNIPVKGSEAVVEAFKIALAKRHRQASTIPVAIDTLKSIWRYSYLITPDIEKQLLF